MKSFLIFACVALALLSCYGTQGSVPAEAAVKENQETVETNLDSRQSVSVNTQRVAQPQARPSRLGVVLPQQCYSCIDCPVVKNNTPVKTCPFQNPRCVVYAESYAYQEKPVYVRGCVLDRGSCEDIKNVHLEHEGIHLVSCYECEGDKCNGSTKSQLSLMGAIFFLIITPLVTKHTFS